MMKFKNTDRLLKLMFLSRHIKAIKAEYLKHTLKTGYVFIRADPDFHAAGKPRFIERRFNDKRFISLHGQEAGDEDGAAHQVRWVYYEVHWDADKTSDYLKEAF